jgi:hypothetical protein
VTDPADIPTPDHIARAIVAACVITGDDPEALADGRAGLPRAAWLAARALKSAFPFTSVRKLLRYVSGGNEGAYTGFGAAFGAERWLSFAPPLRLIETAIRNPTPLPELRAQAARLAS